MPRAERNAVGWMLRDPAARALHGDDWTMVTAEMIGMLRLRTARSRPGPDPVVEHLLSTSDFFRRVWHDQTLSTGGLRRKVLRQPQAGTVEFAVESLLVAHAEGQGLITLTPAPGSPDERAWLDVMAR